MAKNYCVNCGTALGLNKLKSNAGYLCPTCFRTCMNSYSSGYLIKEATIDDITSCFSNDVPISSTIAYSPDTWKPTKVISRFFEVDEKNQLWLIPDGMLGKKKSPIIHRYDEIIEFELLENGDSITKGGLGRAVAGDILFGGVGAIVGGVTGKQSTTKIVNNLQIKITTNNMRCPAIYISLIANPTKTKSIIYQTSFDSAQQILSILSIIIKSMEKENTPTIPQSAADEIRKFKQLLDDGIITQEEFDTKKKELLK